ncbi:MAG: type VI secretion system tip protein VgrG [Pirellulales bacterium]|nr:type VI secretion system tip protein VgrG [Pirellulales bacterium]
MSITQSNRPLAVASPFGDEGIVLLNLAWREQLGQPFQGSLELSSDNGELDPMDVLGQPMSVRIGDTDLNPAYLHGYVSEFGQFGSSGGRYGYRATLVPWIGLLKQAGGSRIFQQQTVVEIAKAVIEDRGFSGELDDRLTQTYRQRAYCVQYDESDFRFLSRLFEEEGIYYFFEYTADQHTLVLCDSVSAHDAVEGMDTLPYHEKATDSAERCVSRWSCKRHFVTASHVLGDYDFQKPRAEMTVRQNASDTASQWQWYRFPGRYFETDDGQHYARVCTEAATANQQTATLEVSSQGLHGGNLLTVQDHPRDDVNQQYLITATELDASAPGVDPGRISGGGGLKFSSTLTVQSSTLPFRTPQRTPRPIMPGPQIATVVGPEGEEIWTDSYGRIKIQFAWDLDGPGDDSSSCWIRVTQPWTGKGWGAISIPRIGDEVIVEFLDGDVDRPIVTGRVFNADRMPPEELADGQAKTILRTRSTKAGDVECFHELTFDDTKDAERIYLHSERDFQRVVENNDSLMVGFEKQSDGDQSIEIFNHQSILIGLGSGEGCQQIEVQQDRSVTIHAGDDTLRIESGDRNVVASKGAVTIQAQTSISLKCGDSTIEITPSGITIESPQIDIQADTQANLAAAEVNAQADAALQLSGGASATLQADGNLTVQGALVQIN